MEFRVWDDNIIFVLYWGIITYRFLDIQNIHIYNICLYMHYEVPSIGHIILYYYFHHVKKGPNKKRIQRTNEVATDNNNNNWISFLLASL